MINKKYIFTSLLFCQKKQGFVNLKKGIKIACSNIIFVDKTEIIDTPYTKFKSVHAQYVAKLRYSKQMLTSLLFCTEVKVFVKR